MTDLKITVGIATRSRPGVLAATLAQLERQELQPTRVVVCYTDPADVEDAPFTFPWVNFLHGVAGLTRQRNAVLASLGQADLLAFFDDDFHPHPEYLLAMQRIFAIQEDVVAATGHVIADGINGPGLSPAQAQEQLDAWLPPPHPHRMKPVFNAYGCNMVLRVSAVLNQCLYFDELLPLYGWYEDVAFSRRLAPFGRIVRVPAAAGVHLGVKRGRQSGLRLGYSQVANPVYLAREGLVSWSYALASMCSRTLKNTFRSLYPEPWVDRRGRLCGNLLGWSEVCRGQSHPTRIVDL